MCQRHIIIAIVRSRMNRGFNSSPVGTKLKIARNVGFFTFGPAGQKLFCVVCWSQILKKSQDFVAGGDEVRNGSMICFS